MDHLIKQIYLACRKAFPMIPAQLVYRSAKDSARLVMSYRER